MKQRAPVGSVLVLLCLCVLTSSARAQEPSTSPSTSPTTAELLKQIQDLQSRVEALQQAQDHNSQTSQKQIDETVTRVLQDADRQSKLIQDRGFTGGWEDGHFVLRSADGNFLLSPELLLQLRYAASIDTSGGNNSQSGFEIRRAKLGFEGHAFTPDLFYFLQWNTQDGGSKSGDLRLEQAWVQYKLSNDWSVRLGQFVDPAVHEQVVRSREQLAVERSMMNQLIAGAGEEFTQAVDAIYHPQDLPLKVEVGYEDGRDSGDTNFEDYPTTTSDFGFLGRAEYVVLGDRKDYADFSPRNTKQELLVLGIGTDFTQTGHSDSWLHTFDVTYKRPDGVALYAAYEANYIDDSTMTNNNSYNYGLLGQIAYTIDPHWEVFGRYDVTHLDHSIVEGGGTASTFNEFTAGVNYYLRGQHAKFTFDASWLPDGSPGLTPLDQTPSDESEFVLRAQFQLIL